MVKKFRIGNPIETDAVIENLGCESPFSIPGMEIREDGKVLAGNLEKNDVVYGLGEQVRGINKRGWKYVSNNTDDMNHTETKESLYGSHNFILLDTKEPFGLFLDTPGKVTWDIGYTDMNRIEITVEHPDYYCYLIKAGEEIPAGEKLKEIVRIFRGLIGRSYIPPKWAFGLGQSRWGYINAEDVRNVVRGYRDNGIPLDSVYMDIDYMDAYKDFTVDTERFPDLADFVQEMGKENIHLVPIIDAGVKVEKGYSVYEEGIANKYFCKDEEDKPFIAAVWPGKAVFPDFLREDVREWFGNQYKFLLDQGIEGFWNDMNEPALFYSEKHLAEVFDELEDYRDKNIGIWEYFAFQDLVNGISNRPEDYASFYHQIGEKKISHDKVHNIYGYNMTRAAGEAMEKLSKEKRILLFSRASYIGMHRYGGIWTGDNQSWWAQLLLSIKQQPSLNMCGFLYSGSDIGGFGANTTEDLLLRWLEFGIFTPLMRNHAALGTRDQEAYRFDQKKMANIIGLRYFLLPYIYSEYMKAVLSDGMYLRPLAFDYPEDQRARKVEDQLLLGESAMIAPVYEQNAEGRYVYLPEKMKLYRLRSAEDYDTEILEQGDHYISCGLDEVLLFLRPDHAVPVAKPGAMSVSQISFDPENPDGLVYTEKEEVTYSFYDDDGQTKDFDLEKRLTTLYFKGQKD